MPKEAGHSRFWERRRLLSFAGMVAAAVAVATARPSDPADELDGLFQRKPPERDQPQERNARPAEQGRLLARPGPCDGAAPLGLQPLGLGRGRDGSLYVPAGYTADRPAPLVLMLHGVRGN